MGGGVGGRLEPEETVGFSDSPEGDGGSCCPCPAARAPRFGDCPGGPDPGGGVGFRDGTEAPGAGGWPAPAAAWGGAGGRCGGIGLRSWPELEPEETVGFSESSGAGGTVLPCPTARAASSESFGGTMFQVCVIPPAGCGGPGRRSGSRAGRRGWSCEFMALGSPRIVRCFLRILTGCEIHCHSEYRAAGE